MSYVPRPPSQGDDSLDSFLANQQRNSSAASDDPALQQFHQYAKANPPARNYTAGISVGFVLLIIVVKVISAMVKSGNL